MGKIDRRGIFEGEETFCDIDTPYRSGPSKIWIKSQKSESACSHTRQLMERSNFSSL
jgi:hypothetical protein